TRYHSKTTIAAPIESRINFNPDEPRPSAQSRRKLSQSIRRRTREGLGQQLDTGIDASIMDDGIAGVTGRKQHLRKPC
ncbi:MAG: hypothetical protein ACKVP3_18040, partial [Hyphomicrobiaceae bacterium]